MAVREVHMGDQFADCRVLDFLDIGPHVILLQLGGPSSTPRPILAGIRDFKSATIKLTEFLILF